MLGLAGQTRCEGQSDRRGSPIKIMISVYCLTCIPEEISRAVFRHCLSVRASEIEKSIFVLFKRKK